MVRTLRNRPWSSYRATSGQSDVPAFLTVDWVFSQFDTDRVRVVRAYHQFVREGKGIDV